MKHIFKSFFRNHELEKLNLRLALSLGEIYGWTDHKDTPWARQAKEILDEQLRFLQSNPSILSIMKKRRIRRTPKHFIKKRKKK